MNRLTIWLILWAVILFMGVYSVFAAYWVDDPNDCPTEYQSQTCTGSDHVCGADGDITYCYDPGSLSAPGSQAVSTSSVDDGSFNGGYLIDCYDYDGSEPHCDNSGSFWCDRNNTLYNSPIYRKTNCSANSFGVPLIGECRSGYYNCYGDSDCESTSTSDCENSNNNHYQTGTCSVGIATPPSPTCECDTSYFACDGSITDADGCEFDGGGSCGGGTGTYAEDECLDASTANCTSTTNQDCNDDDGDGDPDTCNGGGGSPDYCEITAGGSCGSGTGTYQSGICVGSGGNCTRISDYLDCNDDDGDGDELTCNGGDGCEVDDNSACTVGDLAGTVNGCSGGSANCEIDPQDIATTGGEVNWSGSLPFLWMHQYGDGWLFNISNGSNATAGFDNNLCLWLPDSTQVCDSSDLGGTESDPNLAPNLTIIFFNDSYLANYSEDLNLTKLDLTDQRFNNTYTNGTGLNLVGGVFNITIEYFTNLFIELTDGFGGDVTGTYDAVDIVKANFTDKVDTVQTILVKNVTRYPNGACEYTNSTAVLFRFPCDI